MRVSNNLTGTHINRLYSVNTARMEKSIEKLTLGRRINRAADDASGLAISERLQSERRGLKQGLRNAQDGISLIQTVEGALGETQSMLHRMRELAVQSSHGAYVPSDRKEIQNEFEKLSLEIERISRHTEFNTKTLLDGDSTNLDLNIALGTSGKESIILAVQGMGSEHLGLTFEGAASVVLENGSEVFYNEAGFLDIRSAKKASAAISAIDLAVTKAGGERTNMGAVQNRLESAIANLSISVENLQASESGYRDLDLPDEVMALAKGQIISASVTMVLAHANLDPTSVVPLLIGN